jgi:hypothetical protein
MSDEPATEGGGSAIPRVAGVVGVAFGTVTALAAIAYTVMLNVVDWVAVGVLAYPIEVVSPFAVITGAILTIPVVIPTVLISARVLE